MLAGERVGRVWLVDSKQIQNAGLRGRPVGRPWRPASGWSVLALAEGATIEVSPVDRSRARARRADQLGDVVKQFGLDDWSARPNVLLRVVDDGVWPFEHGQRAASRAVVAVDLLESGGSRARRARVELWESLA